MKFFQPITFLTIISLTKPNPIASQPSFSDRSEIPVEYTWDMSDMYSGWDPWEQQYKKNSQQIENYGQFKGTLSLGGLQLYNAYSTWDSLYNETEKLYIYAMMQEDVNDQDFEAVKHLQMAGNLINKLYVVSAFLEPEVLALDTSLIFSWFENTPLLSDYKHALMNAFRRKEHILPEEREKLVCLFENPGYTSSEIYDALYYTDSNPPQIVLSGSDTVILTPLKYSGILKNDTNRYNRMIASESFLKPFLEKKNTCALIVKNAAEMDWAKSQAYGFSSCLEASLFYNNIPPYVFKNVINTLPDSSGPIQKYHRLRAKVLQLEDYSSYDLLIRITQNNEKYPYEEAKEICRKSLSVFGGEYAKYLNYLLDNRRIDVFENDNKISTVAYSVTNYGTSPYLLLNYGETIEDLYIMIHELGHAVHGMYINDYQPLAKSYSPIFVEEVTSTLNELLLTDYLLQSTTNAVERINILAGAIENMEYYYNSSMNADFSYQAYSQIEQGNPFVADFLDSLFLALHTKYYGNSVIPPDKGKWTRYGTLDYYNYQYTTSIAVSTMIFLQLKSSDPAEREEILEKYITLLKAGGDDYPLNQLQKMGIDFQGTEVFSPFVTYTKNMVEQYEEELLKAGMIL